MRASDKASAKMLKCADRSVDLSRTAIMGILNVTPDSFSDGGRLPGVDAALRHAETMQAEGADIIDVGGESTRPGAEAVTVQQELDRVIPVIEALSESFEAVISIDTSKPEVMRAALAAGAGMVNDVNALRAKEGAQVVAQAGVPICLMHMLGEPRTMQDDPHYENVVAQVRDYLFARAQACISAGIDAANILIDPGFGFGKTAEHNLELLRRLRDFGDEFPIMVGLSRKAMIGKLLGLTVDRRVHASVALALIAVSQGARLVRVHDVGPTVEAIRMYESVYT